MDLRLVVVLAFSCVVILLGTDVQEGDILLASTEDPLACLGIEISATLTVVNCSSPSAGTHWKRSRASLGAWASLQLQVPGLPCAGVAGDSIPVLLATHELCQSQWLFRWDSESLRLQVRQSNGSSLKCLQREAIGAGVKVSINDCDSSQDAVQQWLPLPRGVEDVQATLWDISFPLSSVGRHLVDAQGRVIRLRGTNWHGANTPGKVPNGLDRAPLQRVVTLMKHIGFNSVRLPFAIQMWKDHARGRLDFPSDELTANPQLQNLTVLEVLDRTIEEITSQGLLVIMSAHSLDYMRCCSVDDDNGLWYNSRVSEKDWLDALTGLSARWAQNPRVIGFDLYNEVRPSSPEGDFLNEIYTWWDTSHWGNCSDITLALHGVQPIQLGYLSHAGICFKEHAADWRAGATQGAYAVWHGNEDAMVFIQGVLAADLQAPHAVPPPFKQDCLRRKVVWSTHDYVWMKHLEEMTSVLNSIRTGAGMGFEDVFSKLGRFYSRQVSVVDTDWDGFRRLRQSLYTFMLEDHHAPVWVGEFGQSSRDAWWKNFVRLASEMDMDWAHSSFVGIDWQRGLNGVTTDHEWAILSPDLKRLQQPGMLADLISLQAPLVGEVLGVEPEKCLFDAQLQPVTGTGPAPDGFKAYLRSRQSCSDRFGARRLLLDAESGAKDDMEEQAPDEIAMTVATEATKMGTEACSPGWNVRMVSGEGTDTVQQHLVSAASKPNPIHQAFSNSRSPKDLTESLKMQMASTQAAITRNLITFALCVPLLLFGLLLLGFPAFRLKATRFSGPFEFMWRMVRCRCNMAARWQPPMTLQDARKRFRSWRIIVGVLFCVILAGIILSAIWCLLGRSLLLSGVQNVRCTVWSAVEWLLNGKGDFKGVISMISTADKLVVALEPRSTFWTSWDTLQSTNREMSTQLKLFKEALDAINTNTDDRGSSSGHVNGSSHESSATAQSFCPLVSPGIVSEAEHAWKWGMAHAVVMLWQQWDVFLPNLQQRLVDFREQVPKSKTYLARIRDVVSEQFYFFKESDPLGVVESLTTLLLLCVLCLVILVCPSLIISFVVVARFAQNKGGWYACCRCCCKGNNRDNFDNAESLPEKLDLWDKEIWLRPRSSLLAWTSLALYGFTVLAASSWLGIANQVGIDACAVLGDLTPERVHGYTEAIGLSERMRATLPNVDGIPGADRSIEQSIEVAIDILTACISNSGNSFAGSIMSLEICPSEADADVSVPQVERISFRQALRDSDKMVRDRLHGLRGIAEKQGNFKNHSSVQGMIAAILADQQEGSQSCGAGLDNADLSPLRTNKDQRRQLLCEAFNSTCGKSENGLLPSGCDNASMLLLNQSCVEPFITGAEEVSQALADLFEARALAIDKALRQLTSDGLLSLWDEAYKNVLIDVAAIADSLNCKFVRHTFHMATHAGCHEIVAALIDINFALQMLGALCLLLAVMMYFLWLRTQQYVAKARVHREGSLKARGGLGEPLSPRALIALARQFSDPQNIVVREHEDEVATETQPGDLSKFRNSFDCKLSL